MPPKPLSADDIIDTSQQGQGNKPKPLGAGETVSQLEFPDAPTFSEAPISADKLGFKTYDRPYQALGDIFKKSFWQDVGRIGTTAGATLAPYSTDDPKQRQEILVKNVPGVKAVEDKYGNPMIEYEGKKYYMSKPGIDAPDVIRAGLSVAGAAPAAAVAPASLGGAMLLGGATMAGQSAGEDVVARAAGGTSRPWVDPTKLAVNTALGAVMPFAVAKGVIPAAGRINALRPGVLGDDAIRALGLDPDRLTPELRETITRVARRTFGDRQAVGAAYRGALGQEFNVPLTRGEITNTPGERNLQLYREQQIAQTPGGPGENILRAQQDLQNQRLSEAQAMIRGGGGGKPLTPEEAGQRLQQGAQAADQAAKAEVDLNYRLAKDPFVLQGAGVPDSVTAPYAARLGQVTRQGLNTTDQGRVVLSDAADTLTPYAKQALDAVDKFSQKNAGPRATSLSWEDIHNFRKTLGFFQNDAQTATDRAAVGQIIKSFDQHLTDWNPLLKQANALHQERMLTFKPGEPGQDKATETALKALSSDEGGTAITNKIFGGGMSRGEAIQMIDHLNTQVFPNQPEARDAIKEMAIRRLVVDKDGKTLSPQKAVTAIQRALDGELEAPLYQRLFSGEELATLRRFHDLQKTLADARVPVNPSRSALVLQQMMRHASGKLGGGAIGGALGGWLGHAVGGVPGAAAGTSIGSMAGGVVGNALESVSPRMAARSAVNVPRNYAPTLPQGRPGLQGGLLGAEAGRQTGDQPGPADMLMQRAWGLLGP